VSYGVWCCSCCVFVCVTCCSSYRLDPTAEETLGEKLERLDAEYRRFFVFFKSFITYNSHFFFFDLEVPLHSLHTAASLFHRVDPTAEESLGEKLEQLDAE